MRESIPMAVSGLVSLYIMGVAAYELIRWQETVEAFMHPAKSEKPFKTTSFSLIMGTGLSLIVVELSSAESGNYTYAAWCLFAAWLFVTIATIIGLSVYSRRFQVAWSSASSIVMACLLYIFYLITCPTLRVLPNNIPFSATGQSFPVAVENRTDEDTYMNEFAFRVDSEVYSVSEFKFQIDSDSLKPLQQQWDDDSSKVADVFGTFGSLSQTESMFILYVYHLAPHEKRTLGVKLPEHKVTTLEKVEIDAAPIFYSHRPVPVNKDNDVIFVPFEIRGPYTITKLMTCVIDSSTSCTPYPLGQQSVTVNSGCYYFGAVAFRTLPQHVTAGKCEP